MPRKVIGGLIQCHAPITDPSAPIEKVKEAAIETHIPFIEEAGKRGVQILGLQEVSTAPTSARRRSRMVRRGRGGARTHDGEDGAVRQEVRDGDGRPGLRARAGGCLLQHRGGLRCRRDLSGQVPQEPHPAHPGFWEKFYFKPGNLGYPVFQTHYAKVGVYICYDRHFPEGARLLGLNGAEIVFNPSATVAGLSQYLWKLEQPAHAVANGYFMACINRVGTEAPGTSASSTARATSSIRAASSSPRLEDKDELVVAEMDLD